MQDRLNRNRVSRVICEAAWKSRPQAWPRAAAVERTTFPASAALVTLFCTAPAGAYGSSRVGDPALGKLHAPAQGGAFSPLAQLSSETRRNDQPGNAAPAGDVDLAPVLFHQRHRARAVARIWRSCRHPRRANVVSSRINSYNRSENSSRRKSRSACASRPTFLRPSSRFAISFVLRSQSVSRWHSRHCLLLS